MSGLRLVQLRGEHLAGRRGAVGQGPALGRAVAVRGGAAAAGRGRRQVGVVVGYLDHHLVEDLYYVLELALDGVVVWLL